MTKSRYIHNEQGQNTNSAERILPFLLNLIKPTSVVDVGCGSGTWLKVCLDNGIREVYGIDGHHLNKSMLLIPEELVLIHDLEKPFTLPKKYDLAICLEVVEHLDASVAERFIDQLTALSDVVLFSAAIPYQEGQNHINEQWLNYWMPFFTKNGFVAYDVIRPQFWKDQQVDFWYAQNSILFIHSKKMSDNLKQLPEFHNSDLVHPELFRKVAEFKNKIYKGNVSFAFIAKLAVKKMLRLFGKK